MFTQSYSIAQNDQDYILHNTTRYILQNITYNLSGVEIINLNNNNDRFFSIAFFFFRKQVCQGLLGYFVLWDCGILLLLTTQTRYGDNIIILNVSLFITFRL